MPKKHVKPNLTVVRTLRPNENAPLSSFGDRLEKVIDDYCEEEDKRGRIVTCAEIIGVLDMLKDTVKGR